ncbi:hypothetical protein SARC_03587 [Sphaeroforma arctica JP610]|uniref:Uncharacterized protein n=1 Tax=Sphaeroforma arctica JP610 TaxID=667725 RepID=A0A0L0G7J9_9EUKA|nr:hypothetical protein SARC_03587 [Sphaeroforma arctica JP610]KNC84198.1 hypothetical protein SARC_03587 [Sphaeroforma arctica JP610]|eukprot:XP_014158100.1 hypothetical protein SARC_03587 [Sphaeroforma arctica JP610]
MSVLGSTVQSTGNQCGSTYADSTKCEISCPGGIDSECPAGEFCFRSVECGSGIDDVDRVPTGSYCGTNSTTAGQCSLPCRNGIHADCIDPELKCFDGIVCDFLKEDNKDAECNTTVVCPLNACCSQWGFCGWTEDYCNVDCISDCQYRPSPPACDGTAPQVRLGYYASWATARECRPKPPVSLASIAGDYTHLVFSFAHVSIDFKIEAAAPTDEPLFKEFTDLKVTSPALRCLIAVGGWAFNDKPTQHRFTDMTNNTASRAVFIQSAVDFLERYNFDGIDLDWEYPGAPDRGGNEGDYANYVALITEMRSAFVASGKEFSITMAVPLSNWYLRHFDINALQYQLDFFNVMSYDLHGVWDGVIPTMGAKIIPHTNMAEIEENFKMFWKNGVAPHKLVLGLAAYGRTYTLLNNSCIEVGCEFESAGAPGECTRVAGFQGHFEIEAIIQSKSYDSVTFDADTGSMILVKDREWIAYDSADTFSLKKAFAMDNCLRGSMVWSVDMIDEGIVY